MSRSNTDWQLEPQLTQRGLGPAQPAGAAATADGEEVSYRLGARVGVSGQVYEAHDTGDSGQVVIKLYPSGKGLPAAAIAAFRRDALRVADLRHPHVAQVIRAGAFADGMPFVTMERLCGQTLEERIASADRRSLPVPELLAIVRGIASALSAAHGAGVAHGELRADNVFIAEMAGYPTGFVKVLDFGAWRLSAAARAAGRVVDQPGERERGREREDDGAESADQIALGALCYRLLKGPSEGPFDPARASAVGQSPQALTRLLGGADPFPGQPAGERPRRGQGRSSSPLVGCGPAIDAVLGKALSARPEDRFDSIGQLGRAIEEALTGALIVSGGSIAVPVAAAAAIEIVAPPPAPELTLTSSSLSQQFFAEGDRQEASLLDVASSSSSFGAEDAPLVDAAKRASAETVPRRRAPLLAAALLAVVGVAIAARATGLGSLTAWRASGAQHVTPPAATPAPAAQPTVAAAPAIPSPAPVAVPAPVAEISKIKAETDTETETKIESPRPPAPRAAMARAAREPALHGYAWSPRRGLVPADVAPPLPPPSAAQLPDPPPPPIMLEPPPQSPHY